MGSVWLDPGRHGHAPPHAPTHVMAAEVTARVSRGEGPDLTGRESRQMRHLINAQQWLPSLDAQPSMFGTWDTQRRRTLPCPGHRWLLLSPPDFLCFTSSFHCGPHNHTNHLVRVAPVSPTDNRSKMWPAPSLSKPCHR